MDNDIILQEIAIMRASLFEVQTTLTELLARLAELEAQIRATSGEHAYGDPGISYPVSEEG